MNQAFVERASAYRANKRAGEVLGTSVVAETDAEGPRLLGIMRKAVIAGMVAVTALSAVAPAAAATIDARDGSPAVTYVTQVNKSLDAAGGPNGIKGVGVKLGVKQDTVFRTDVASDGIVSLPWSGKTCTVSVATPVTLGNALSEAVVLPDGVKASDVARHVAQMDGTNVCFAMAKLGNDHLVAYNGTKVGLTPLAEVMTVLATLKFEGREAYGEMMKLKSAVALAEFKSTNNTVQELGLLNLQSLGSLGKYLEARPDAVEKIQKAELGELLNFAHTVTMNSKQNLKHLDVTSGLGNTRGAAPESIPGKLEGMGLTGAAAGAQTAVSSGLLQDADILETNTMGRITPITNLRAGSAFSGVTGRLSSEYGGTVKSQLDKAFGEPTHREEVAYR